MFDRGGRIGRAGTSPGAGGDDNETWERRSDAAHLSGPYRYTKYELTPPPTFNKC
jgi:hypothetical protein